MLVGMKAPKQSKIFLNLFFTRRGRGREGQIR